MISPIFLKRKAEYDINIINFLLDDSCQKLYEKVCCLKIQCDKVNNEIVSQLNKKIDNSSKKCSFRKELINLKKEILKGKNISNMDINCMSLSLQRCINKYNNLLSEYYIEYENLKQKFESEYINQRYKLQNIYTSNNLKNTIENTISESAFNKLEKYLDVPVCEHNKNLRKLDMFLLKFITRATLKTSPFADLTSTKILLPTLENHTKNRLLYFANVNYAILLQILEKLYLEEDIYKKLEFSINRTLIFRDNKYFITIPSTRESETASVFNNSQKVISIVSNDYINIILKIFGNKKLSYYQSQELYFKLKKLDNGIFEKYFLLLIKEKVLVPHTNLDTTNGDLLFQIMNFLEEKNYNNVFVLEKLKKLLYLTRKGYKKYELIDKKELTTILKELLNYFDITNIRNNNLLYYDAVSLGYNKFNLNSSFSNLMMKYQFLILIFDPIQRIRLLVADDFCKEYGNYIIPQNVNETSNVLRFLGSKLNKPEERNIYFGNFPWNKTYKNKILNGYNVLCNNLMEDIDLCSNNDEVIISEKLLNRYFNKIKKITNIDLISHAFFLQKQNNDYILNHSYKGYSIFYNRFIRYFSTPNIYEKYVDRNFNNNNIADIRYTYGFNANIRKEVTKKSFILPYDDSFKRGVKWTDIYFKVNSKSNILEFFDKKTNEKIRPQFLGSLISGLCPSIHVVFDMLSSHGTIYNDLGEINLRKKISNTTDINMISIPRIVLQNDESRIIVSRKKWLINCSQLTRIIEKNSLFEEWFAISSYFYKNKIPYRFYAKVFLKELDKQNINIVLKPQFINLSSPLLYKLFKHLFSNNNYLILEEELPIANESSKNVTEYIVEQTLDNEDLL